MPTCREGEYHLNINPPRGVPKTYEIHKILDCGNMGKLTDLKCLHTRNRATAVTRAYRHITSLHWYRSRHISFCRNCCRDEAEEYD